jgi:hypothetical protein
MIRHDEVFFQAERGGAGMKPAASSADKRSASKNGKAR